MSNQVQIKGEMLEALKTRPIAEWKELFASLQKQKAMQISGCVTSEDLITLRAQVRNLQELESYFLSEMTRK